MVKIFIKRHLMIFIGAGLCIVMMLAGSVMKSSAEKSYREAENHLTDLRNQLIQQQQVVDSKRTRTVYEVSGLDLARVSADSQAALEWITPAFTFDSVDEYNENRAIYVERLGEDSDFVTAIMPPYIPSNVDEDGYILNPDGTYKYDKNGNKMKFNFNMTIKTGSFTPYVAKIDEETGVYTYVAFFLTTSNSSGGYTGSGDQRVIITYTMGDDHQMHDFKCQLETSQRSY